MRESGSDPMRYRLSEAAYDDYLELYAEGVGRFGGPQAVRYSDSLERTFEQLAINPGMARLREELADSVRIHPHGSHLIAYQEQDDGILILRIRHARENWQERPI